MSDINFYRRCVLSVGQSGGAGFQIGGIQNARQETLHIAFSVEKSDAESSNTAKIQVWNLSDQNLRTLDTKDVMVELRAGYEDHMALILAGNVTHVTTSMDNADRLTEIEVTDGRVVLRDTYLSLSRNGKADTRDLYNAVASQMGLPVQYARDLSFVTLPNGFSFVGKAKDALQKITRANSHVWTIQNGVLQITLPGRPVDSYGHLLSVESGLINIPKRITISQTGDNSDSLTGWEVVYFLNGAIGVNDVVQIRSGTANGYYRVHKVTIDGDNLEGDWVCTAEVLEIKALPKLDAKTRI